MSQQFTIRSTGNPEEWQSQHGPMMGYKLDLEDGEGKLHLRVASNRKVKDGSHNEPAVGEVVMGDISLDKAGNDRLVLDYDAMKEMGSSSSGGADYSRKPTGGEPNRQAAIQRQCALKVMAASINAEGLTDRVKGVCEELEDFINTASGTDTHSNGSVAPPAPAVPSVPSQTPDVHQRLTVLLEENGENPAAATLITNWAMADGLQVKEQDAAIKALEDPAKRVKAVARLRERYTSVNGELPDAEPFDTSIPF